MAEALLECSLPKPEWTHEVHVLVCVALVRRHGPGEALRILRLAIPRYNLATGVANTATSGYHDTLTVFYVWSVNQLVANGLTTAQILAHPQVSREAALHWWDRNTLFSSMARLAFVAPTVNQHNVESPRECFPAPVSD